MSGMAGYQLGLNKQKIAAYITFYESQNGKTPTMGEIAKQFGATKAAISYQCIRMREAGMIDYDSKTPRSFVVLNKTPKSQETNYEQVSKRR